MQISADSKIQSKMLRSHPYKDFVFDGERVSYFDKRKAEHRQGIEKRLTKLSRLIHPDQKGKHSYVSISPVNPDAPAPSLSPSRIRAIGWRAEAFASTFDQPNLLVANRFENIFRHYFLHPEKWVELGLTEPQLEALKQAVSNGNASKEDLMLLQKGAVKLQNSTLNKLESHRFIRKKALLNVLRKGDGSVTDDARRDALYLDRLITLERSDPQHSKIAACNELQSYARLKLYFSSRKAPDTIPVMCHITFTNSDDLLPVASGLACDDHELSILLDKEQYIYAVQNRLFSEFTADFDEKLDLAVPVSPRLESEQATPHSLSEREVASCPSDQTVSSPESSSLEQKESFPMPPLFRKVTAVIADPWIKESAVVTEESWKKYLKNIARECGKANIGGYQLNLTELY